MGNLFAGGKTRSSLEQLTRFAFVGVVSNLAGYLIYLLITYLGATPKLTMTFLYGVGATIGYIGNHKLTFDHKGSVSISLVKYIITHALGYLFNFTMLVVLVDIFGYAHQWVQAVAVLIGAFFFFLAFKFYVFSFMSIKLTVK